MGAGPYRVVDVFAERKYAGNPLTVFTDAAHLSTEEMQAVARETNHSETTFVVGRSAVGWKVRIFTPAEEIPFAGHPTLGTAAVLRAEGEREVVLDLKVGPIPVTFRDDGLAWMRQNPPTFGKRADGARVAPLLGLDAADLDPRLPVEDVSTGLPHLVVPLADRGALARARLDLELHRRFVEREGVGKSVLVFARGGHLPDGDVSVRVFCPWLGPLEDPATGSGNGCLAAYLARHRVLGDAEVDARADQGHEMGRPSRLHLKAVDDGTTVSVHVGGRVVPVARGTFD